MEDSSNNSFFKEILIRFIKLLNPIIMSLVFAGVWYSFYADKIVSPFYDHGNWAIIILFGIIYTIYARMYDSFMISMAKRSEIIYSQSLALLISNGLMYFIVFILMRRLPNVLPLLLAFLIQIILTIGCTWAVNKWYFKNADVIRTIVVYDEQEDLKEWQENNSLKNRFNIVKTLSVNDFKLKQLTGKIGCIFLIDVHSHQRNQILKYCVANNVQVMILPRIGDVIMSGADNLHILHLPILTTGRYHPKPEFLIIKRSFDLIVSILVFILVSPVFLLVSILIKFDDQGPVFYKQERLTKNGKRFKVIKFRSMRTDAEKDGVARLSTGDQDNRVTKIGKFLRKVRLDEIPQLINIIKGEMSIVGPRPERPSIATQYEKKLPEFNLRLQAKAGLTGYAQVYGKYNTDPYNKLKMDLMYIAHPSVLEDLKIMFATVKIIFISDSTEGIDSDKTNAI
ncbi:exopolysaccharide biosynthesis polyprenyl glycosylphosphotransferase [Levilactobacillus huananensis]|uniref:exopolysaccharide biosynthesis polyprenyl glycosylphosphotransferase n=1 Tax=Levilactobacillus huananensis TaxID=2486019 RepID=UPI000F788B3E|nr:exopolysaccharide biosynthesis polyprenyl glycosylphosphotransferase [Levilactobacillus huananensis]